MSPPARTSPGEEADPFHPGPLPSRLRDPSRLFTFRDSHWPVALAPGVNVALPRALVLALVAAVVAGVAVIAS